MILFFIFEKAILYKMKNIFGKFVLLVILSALMTACFSTKQSCGVAHIQQSVKREPVQKYVITNPKVGANIQQIAKGK